MHAIAFIVMGIGGATQCQDQRIKTLHNYQQSHFPIPSPA